MSFLILLATLSAGSGESEKASPQGAYVTVRSAAVRSGPSDDAYITDRLEWGRKVEVYRTDDAQWCAIRPPDGSFSWVRKRSVRLTEDPSIGEMVRGDVPSQIGTRFGENRDANHVLLSRGELVEILGLRRLVSVKTDNPMPWYMISPPAGEFRWIHESDLSPSPPKEIAPSHDAILPALSRPDSADDRQPDAVDHIAYLLQADQSEPRIAVTRHLEELVRPGTSPHYPQRAILTPRSTSQRRLAAVDVTMDDGTIDDELLTGNAPNGRSEVDRRELAKLELALARTVIGVPEQWRLKPIEYRARFIIETTRDAGVRQRAQSLLSKLIDFDDVRRRQMARATASDTHSGQALRASPSSRMSSNTVVGSGVLAANNVDYAGRGYLMPVISQQPNAPKFALTDSNGQILKFVFPAPGVNLSNYERKEIAVIGQQSARKQFGRPRLIAHRIVELNRVQR
jgi:hypothetical protein